MNTLIIAAFVLAVVGSLETYSYAAKDGTKKYGFEIILSDIEFLSNASGGNHQSAAAAPAQDTGTGYQEVDEDELPF